MVGRSILFLATVALGCTGCSSVAPARPQLLIVIDTDAPVIGQLASHPEISPDAVIDTVRVDAVKPDGSSFDLRDFVAPEPLDWPLSFGVASAEATPGAVRLRIRGFRGSFARPGEVNGIATLEPEPGTAIDRVIDLDLPSDGVLRIRILLSADCMGATALFPVVAGDPTLTCIDGAHRSANAKEGVEKLAEDETPPSRVGTWASAQEVHCTAPTNEDRVCVPGGFTILGDLAFTGVTEILRLDSAPLHPALLSPFLLDRTEFTVGRFRTRIAKMIDSSLLPVKKKPGDPLLGFCTWLGPDDATNDALPLNCVTLDATEAACKLDGGGFLPSEAQWEHAARGRGQRRLYPWGNDTATCCAVSASRPSELNDPLVECTMSGLGLEPVGSHPVSEACNGLGDVSRDGVLDLGGSLSEVTRDKAQPFTDPCWKLRGVQSDPVCLDEGASAHIYRGANWHAGLSNALAPFRYTLAQVGPTVGFRCAYPGSVQ